MAGVSAGYDDMSNKIETMKAFFTYTTALVVLVGGGFFLYATVLLEGDGIASTRLVIAGLMGSAATFLFMAEGSRGAVQSFQTALGTNGNGNGKGTTITSSGGGVKVEGGGKTVTVSPAGPTAPIPVVIEAVEEGAVPIPVTVESDTGSLTSRK